MANYRRRYRAWSYRNRFRLGQAGIALFALGVLGIAVWEFRPAVLAVALGMTLFGIASHNVHHGSGGGDADARLIGGGSPDPM